MYKNIPKLIKYKALENYKLFVHFEDGISGEVDLSHLNELKIFKEYWIKNDNFKNFMIIKNYITWNEVLDIDTLNLYLELTQQNFEEYANN